MKTNKFFDEYCKENVILNFEGDLHTFTEGVAFIHSSVTFQNGNKKYIKTETDKGADINIVNEDNGTLSHFHLQSTSDQEIYYNYASIAASSNAIMPPEKAANWANPYFLGEEEYEEFDKGENTDYLIHRNLDGEATIFSMINGMVGVPLISGRIDYFDELNFALAKEAVDCYKAIRKDIAKSYAVYPTGTELMGKRSYITAGLMNEEKTKMYLSIWKVNAYEDEVMVDLSKYIGGDADVKMIYPHNDDKCSYRYAKSLKKLTVKMDKNKYMARLFEINMK